MARATHPRHEQVLEPDEVDAHVRSAVSEWPQIDPDVEGIVVRVGKADRMVERAAKASLARAGLTFEEFKVLICLHHTQRSHGALCDELMVSTGAMTNRLDKLERGGLVARKRDPDDRRGVLLEITAEGRERLDAYIDLQARRERELLKGLDADEQQQLNGLLRKLLRSLQSELGTAHKRSG